MRKQHESIRVFKSDFMERLTHVHPITPLVVWAPVVAWFFWRSSSVHSLSIPSIVIAGLSGLIFWSLAEYVLHRHVFHMKTDTPIRKRMQFLIHGLHHDDPEDPTRLVFPPAPAIVLAAILYGLFRLVLGEAWVEPFFSGFIIGYLCYDYIHFSVHHFKPRTRVGKFLKQSHMVHHFVAPDSRWGVSSPLWDYVFGTLESQKRQTKPKLST